MASKNPFERYLSTGLAVTQLTRKRAEEIVRELVQEGEVGRDHAEEWVEDLMTRSRRNAELLTTIVRNEVRRQVDQLGLVDRDDLKATIDRVLNVARKAGQRTVLGATRRAGSVTATAASEVEQLRSTGEHRVRAGARGGTAQKAGVTKARKVVDEPAARKTAAKKTQAKKTARPRAANAGVRATSTKPQGAVPAAKRTGAVAAKKPTRTTSKTTRPATQKAASPSAPTATAAKRTKAAVRKTASS
ncbi:MAG: phasin family protein [Acidimicrobiales bacterium]